MARYADGLEVRLGDKVRMDGAGMGEVVFSLDTGEFSDAFPATQWAYLERGVMLSFEKLGLVYHAGDVDADIVLIRRAEERGA